MGRFTLSLIASMLSLAVSSPVAAQEHYRLHFIVEAGAEVCPPEAVVASEVSLRLGRNPFSGDAAQELEVRLGRRAEHFTAGLSVRRPDGSVAWSQPLESDEATCDTLADATVLGVALMIDPESLAPPEEPSIAPVERVAPAAVPVVPMDRQAASPALPPPPPMAARLGVALMGAVLPRLAFGALLGVGGGLPGPLRWGASMRFFPEVRTDRPDDSFAFGLTTLSVSLCGDVRPLERLRVGLCVSPTIGVIHAVVYEPDPTVPGDRLWAGVGTGVSAGVGLVGPLWLMADVGVIWSILRQHFTVRDRPAPAFEQDLVGLSASLSLAVRFP